MVMPWKSCWRWRQCCTMHWKQAGPGSATSLAMMETFRLLLILHQRFLSFNTTSCIHHVPKLASPREQIVLKLLLVHQLSWNFKLQQIGQRFVVNNNNAICIAQIRRKQQMGCGQCPNEKSFQPSSKCLYRHVRWPQVVRQTVPHWGAVGRKAAVTVACLRAWNNQPMSACRSERAMSNVQWCRST